MALDKSAAVAAAQNFANKFNYDKVYIIGVNNATGKFEIVSYGKTMAHCNAAKVNADKLFDLINCGKIKID